MADPTAMHLELALFRGDDLLHRGSIYVQAETALVAFGSHQHVVISEAPRLEAALFDGIIVEHRFELPSSPVTISLYEVKAADPSVLPRQVLRLKIAAQFGVNRSDDWENLAFGEEYTLAFRTTPLAGRSAN